MKLHKSLFAAILLTSGLLTSNLSYAAAFAGNGTPTTYVVTLKKVSFHRVGAPANQFVSYASGSGEFDIAAASVGNPIGTLQSNGNLGPGAYDQMRFEVARPMRITANYMGAALPNGVTKCRTTRNPVFVNNPFGDGSVNGAYLGSTDGGAAEEGTISVPSGTSVDLPFGFVVVGDNIQGTVNITNFVVTGEGVPDMTTSFDVTSAVMFAAYGASGCVIFPGPPTVTVS